jgi:hypothetical protein
MLNQHQVARNTEISWKRVPVEALGVSPFCGLSSETLGDITGLASTKTLLSPGY